MPPNQSPQNLGLALAQMNQGSIPQFGDTQVNPQQLRGATPPAPASYGYQPQSQMSQMQLSPTQQSMYMPQQQQQSNPLGQAMGGMAQSLNRINQQYQNQPDDPYQSYGQPDYGTMMNSGGGSGIFGY